MQTERFRFGDFDFDADSGELRRRQAPAGAPVQRLPPQPARLLALLAERGGELLGRDEIRTRLWPDVEVDFEMGLHACIRQIRAVLGDSATEPRYVETLPRRGYRLVPRVERVDAEASAPSPVRSAWRRRGLAALLTMAAAGLAWWLAGPGTGAPAGAPLRIGIMPFVPPAGTTVFGRPAPIADAILEDLTSAAGPRADVVGPTTTAAWADSDASLRDLAAEFRLDYVVNGRFVDGEDGPRMLAELIRASDGAHVWVRAYQDLRDDRRIGSEISRAVVSRLELAASQSP